MRVLQLLGTSAAVESWNDGRDWVPLEVTDVEHLLLELTRQVVAVLEEPNTYVIVLTGFNRYVQVASDRDGGLRAETVANEFLCDAEMLSPADEAHLAWLGWLPPDEEHPNWWRDFAPVPWPAELVAALCARTLLDVHLGVDTVLRVTEGRF